MTTTTTRRKAGKDWRFIGIMLAIVLPGITWLWQFAQYPDRAEFNEVKAEVRKVDKETTTRLHQIQTEQRVIKKDIEQIRASQGRVEQGLDRLLQRRYRAGHSRPSGADSR